MKNILSKFLSLAILLLPLPVYASEYTLEEISKHANTADCWMVFEDGVYDLTEYIVLHDRYMDIRDWCGNDMTEDFQDKAGKGVDHKGSSYALLEEYRIGDIASNTVSTQAPDEVVEETTEEEPIFVDSNDEESVAKDVTVPKEYNLLIPFLVTVLTYWLGYFLVRKNRFFGISMIKFNAFWNSILFLTLLVPSLGFGVFMVIRTHKPELYDIDFEFLYWHVELSLVMGFLGMNHFIQRFMLYVRQLAK